MKHLAALAIVLLLASAARAQEDDAIGAGGLEATETSPNADLSTLTDEELMAELERRKAELAGESPPSSAALDDEDYPTNDTIYLTINETVPSYPIDDELAFQDPVKDFVQIRGNEFVVVNENEDGDGVEAMCEPFFLTGWNSWDVTRVPRIRYSNDSTEGQQTLTRQLQTASQSGLNVVRAWAHTIDPSYPVMKSPGVYDEEGLKAIDFLLSEANKYGIRVILSFVDNWKYPGGVDQMIDWSETAPNRSMPLPESLLAGGDYNQRSLSSDEKNYIVKRHSLFYTDEGARQIYRDYVKTLVNRKNVYNGKVYKDDPTILAWNLINEPRCETWLVEDCESKLQNWIETESAYVKELDPNHLVTVGEEGFWSADSPNEYANPTWWARAMGQNFRLNHMPDSIDFATIHIWPDTWSRPELSFQKSWILSHMREAEEELGKPLVSISKPPSFFSLLLSHFISLTLTPADTFSLSSSLSLHLCRFWRSLAKL